MGEAVRHGRVRRAVRRVRGSDTARFAVRVALVRAGFLVVILVMGSLFFAALQADEDAGPDGIATEGRDLAYLLVAFATVIVVIASLLAVRPRNREVAAQSVAWTMAVFVFFIPMSLTSLSGVESGFDQMTTTRGDYYLAQMIRLESAKGGREPETAAQRADAQADVELSRELREELRENWLASIDDARSSLHHVSDVAAGGFAALSILGAGYLLWLQPLARRQNESREREEMLALIAEAQGRGGASGAPHPGAPPPGPFPPETFRPGSVRS